MKKIFYSIFGVILIGVISFLILIQSEEVQSYVVSQAIKKIEKETGWTIHVESFKASFPLVIQAKKITIAQFDKIWLDIDQINLSISTTHLFKHRLTIKNAFADTVKLNHLPKINPETEVPLPDYLRVSDLDVSHLFIGSALVPDTPFFSPDKPHHAIASFDLDRDNHHAVLNLKLQDESSQEMHLTADGSLIDNYTQIQLEASKGMDESIKATARLYDNSSIKVELLQAKMERLEVTGKVELDSLKKLDGTDLAFIYRLNTQSNNLLKGKIQGSCVIFGSLDAPNAHMEIEGLNTEIAEIPIENLKSEINLQYKQSLINGEGKTTFDALGRSLQGSTEFKFVPEKELTFTKLQLQSVNNHIDADFTFYIPDLLIAGRFNSEMSDLEWVKLFYDEEIQGSLKASGELFIANSGPHDQQGIEFAIQSPGIVTREWKLDQVFFKGYLQNIFQNPKGDLNFSANHFSLSHWKFSHLKGHTMIYQNDSLWPFEISAQEHPQTGIDFMTNGTWNVKQDSFTIELNDFKGHLKKVAFILDKPTTLTINPKLFSLSQNRLKIGESIIETQLDINFLTMDVQGSSSWKRIPLSFLKSISPELALNGVMDLNIQLHGPVSAIQGTIEGDFKDVILTEDTSIKIPLQGTISANLDSNGLKSQIKIKGTTNRPMILETILPIAFSLNPVALHFNKEKPLYTRLVAHGKIAPFLEIFLTEKTSLDSDFNLDLAISGTFNQPEILGHAELNQGYVESLNTGAIFKNLHAVIDAKGKKVFLKEFRAYDEKGGEITGNGSLLLDIEKKFPFEFSFHIARSQAIDLDYAQAVLSGNTKFLGNADEALLQGSLSANSLRITVPEEIPALTDTIDVIYINQQRSKKSPIFYTKDKATWPIKLDVELNIPNTAVIKGEDWNSRWEGSVKMSGDTFQPLFNGELKIVNGQYSFNGKAFEINQGIISFGGEFDKKTSLYVIASRDLGKLDAEIILRGPLKNPSIAFRSNPPMSQREVLSWILFNQGTSDLSPFQGAELSESIVLLNKGKKTAPDFLTKLKSSLGLDRIDISGDQNSESNEMSLQVGKYISKGIFVTLNKSIGADNNRVGVEAKITKNIKVEAYVSDGDDADGQILLIWKHDY